MLPWLTLIFLMLCVLARPSIFAIGYLGFAGYMMYHIQVHALFPPISARFNLELFYFWISYAQELFGDVDLRGWLWGVALWYTYAVLLINSLWVFPAGYPVSFFSFFANGIRIV